MPKTRRILIISAALIFAFMICQSLFAIRIFKTTITVKDEFGNTVEDAAVGSVFRDGKVVLNEIEGRTNKNGKISYLGIAPMGVTGGGVVKAGYYQSTFHHDFFIRKFGIWQPWNKEIQVTLRPIINPVPMYVRSHTFSIPKIGENIGFDLNKSDWVFPYGRGTQSDFIFRAERQYKDIDNFDATLTMTFTNKYDGIQLVKEDVGGDFSVGSKFRLPRQAPDEGYQNKWTKRVSTGVFGERHNAKIEGYNYIFRVRSETENGHLKRAMYGKIRGDIRFGPAGEKAGFEMLYYLNPDFTRNLEFDPKRNLFILPEGERIGLP